MISFTTESVSIPQNSLPMPTWFISDDCWAAFYFMYTHIQTTIQILVFCKTCPTHYCNPCPDILLPRVLYIHVCVPRVFINNQRPNP